MENSFFNSQEKPQLLQRLESKAEDILSSEKEGRLVGEIIEGPEIPLKILKNHFTKQNRNLAILIHGARLNEFDLAPLLSPLQEKGINALAYGWRGHGQGIPFNREVYGRTGVNDMLADAESVVTRYQKELSLDESEITLVGHSFGTIIGSLLAKKGRYKSMINLAAGMPNRQYLETKGVDLTVPHDVASALGDYWGFRSEQVIHKTIEEASRGVAFESMRERGMVGATIKEFFNLDVPNGYAGPIERLLGPSGRLAIAEGCLVPPAILSREDISTPMHFIGSSHDERILSTSVQEVAASWGGTYQEVEGSHMVGYDDQLNVILEAISTRAG